jgi:hypothetical protein
MLPQFTFIVETDVSKGEANTMLTIDACATNYTGGMETEMRWSDTYSTLPVPAAGFGPSEAPLNVINPREHCRSRERRLVAEHPQRLS